MLRTACVISLLAAFTEQAAAGVQLYIVNQNAPPVLVSTFLNMMDCKAALDSSYGKSLGGAGLNISVVCVPNT
jgi:hypothetical protein